MWGTLGLVYNPDIVSAEEASHWDLLSNSKYYKRVTIKDSIRDAYFGALCSLYYDEITSDEFVNSEDYKDRLDEVLNRTDVETVNGVQEVLTDCKNNVYSFETVKDAVKHAKMNALINNINIQIVRIKFSNISMMQLA